MKAGHFFYGAPGMGEKGHPLSWWMPYIGAWGTPVTFRFDDFQVFMEDEVLTPMDRSTISSPIFRASEAAEMTANFKVESIFNKKQKGPAGTDPFAWVCFVNFRSHPVRCRRY